MHSRALSASPPSSPRTVFSGPRINALRHAATFAALQNETACSHRPFARLQRRCLSASPFQGQRSRPATSQRSPDASTPRSVFRLRPFAWFAPSSAGFLASNPLTLSPQTPRTAPPASTPLRDFCLPPDQSVPLAGCPAACLPNPPDFRSLPAARNYFTSTGLRITVPGPLRFRRLAVPQTSWNLLHYAPATRFSSTSLCVFRLRFLNIYFICLE